MCSFGVAVAVLASWVDTEAAHASVQFNTKVCIEYLVFQLLSLK